MKCFGEFEIPLIVSRNGHDGSRAIGCENVVGYPNRDLFPVHRIHDERTERGASLAFGKFGAFEIGFGCAFPAVFFHYRALGRGGERGDQGVFGSQYDVSRPKKGIWTGGVNGNLF